ncbi:MAG: Multiple RNA-binding domain-containing protein 1 [Pleopsidium flavum]|nr:MAG: Multiple RNA-binding domain-containing protein 1 [Pleopsidium flavum]
MESSRIFVRGLPPNITEVEFRRHFSKQCSVTDTKIMPHRHIGYVGYKTHEHASSAVKYFNKSFIRMSRIGVELARPIEHGSLSRTEGSRSQVIQGRGEDNPVVDNRTPLAPTDNKLKRKREATDEPRKDAKLQEYLEVMQPPSKSKSWANEDNSGARTTTAAHIEAPDLGVQNGQPNERFEKVLKRSRPRSPNSESQEHPKLIKPLACPLDEHRLKAPAALHIDTLPVHPMPSPESDRDGEEAPKAASDADWLRTRTSRLLGLTDNDEDLNQTAVAEPSALPSPEAQLVVDHAEEFPTSNAEPEGNEEAMFELAPLTLIDSNFAAIELSGRLFVRNLPYEAEEEDLRQFFSSTGDLEEVHLPIDSRSLKGRGYAYLQYTSKASAVKAYQTLDGSVFQGRLLHVLPAAAKKETKLDEFAISKLPVKKQKQIKRKAEAASGIFNWNSMYMNSNAIMSSISDRLGIAKSDLLDPTSSDAAVKQAHAETHLIQETKSYFAANGIDLEAFKKRERGDSAILVKNFMYGTKIDEIKQLFEQFGRVSSILMPPSGTIAIVKFEQSQQAKAAFSSLAYRKFKESILFLEKAPKDLFTSEPTASGVSDVGYQVEGVQASKPSASDLLHEASVPDSIDTSTLFVRNLNFSTTTQHLDDVFKPLDGFLSARVKTKPDPKKAGGILSMGFGFLEFGTKQQAQTALAAMNGYKLDGHELLIRASHKAIDAAEERKREDRVRKAAGRRTKVIIKNLPFEASKKDVRSLFGSYGQLRSVRVPKKFDSSTRGFAFADFVTAREAENAMDALKDTHLLGRKLVLDFAAEDAADPEEEITKMQKKVGRQINKVAVQKLAGAGRRKFNVQGNEEIDES